MNDLLEIQNIIAVGSIRFYRVAFKRLFNSIYSSFYFGRKKALRTRHIQDQITEQIMICNVCVCVFKNKIYDVKVLGWNNFLLKQEIM